MPFLFRLSAVITLSLAICIPAFAQDALFVDADGAVGIGTNTPSAPFHVFRDDDTLKFLFLESNAAGGAQDRAMMQLNNNGGIRFQFDNTALGTAWRFQAATGNADNFEIAKVGTGAIELRLDGSGNLTIQGSLTELSDREAKQNIAELDGTQVLARLEELPISQWRYKSDPQARHAGPMAQDFHAAFGLGRDDRYLSPRDMAGVSLAAIKALKAENDALKVGLSEKDEAIARLKKEKDAEIASLRADNASLEERLEKLEALMQAQK